MSLLHVLLFYYIVRTSIVRFNSATILYLSKPRTFVAWPHVKVVYVFNGLKREQLFRFVDIDHRSFYVHFIIRLSPLIYVLCVRPC
jgi:hypothetical protein